jgi:uncharacterized membrane protein YqjE
MTNNAGSSRFTDSFTELGDSLLCTLQQRTELISLEFREEKGRLMQLIVWISVAVFAGVMMLSFATLSIVYLFWETARIGALIGCAIAYASLLAWVIVTLRKSLNQSQPF